VDVDGAPRSAVRRRVAPGAGERVFERVVYVHVNVDGLRTKVRDLGLLLEALQRSLGAPVVAVGLCETKLRRDAPTPVLPGFWKAARRDREEDGGGGVVIYVREGVAASALADPDADQGAGAEACAVKLGSGPRGPLFWAAYRAPGADIGAFLASLAFYAGQASAAGAAFVGATDANLPTLRRSRDAARTADATAFESALVELGLDIENDAEFTFLRNVSGNVQSSALDVVVANEAARVLACGIENCGRSAVLGEETWTSSQHCALWALADVRGDADIELDLGEDVKRLTPLPRARWSAAGDEERERLVSLIEVRQAPLVRQLASSGLDAWNGRWAQAASALVSCWVACETDAIGRGRRPPDGATPEGTTEPRHWDATVRATARSLRRAAAAAREATAARARLPDDASPSDVAHADVAAMLAEEARTAAQREHDARSAVALSRFVSASEDTAEAHRYVGAMMAAASADGGDDVFVCRALVDAETGELELGAAAVAVLSREYGARQSRDPRDPAFCLADLEARERAFAALRSRDFPRERREAEDAARRAGGRDWRSWARAVRRGDVRPTPEERAAFEASPYETWEVLRAMRRLKTNRAASPIDGLSSNLVKNGGEHMARALTLLLDLRFRRPWSRTPSQVPHALGIFKGRGRDPLQWTSWRMVMLLSYVTKIDEAVLLYRSLVCAEVDEAQSVANAGVDGRHQLHVALDVAALRRARGETAPFVVVDIERGFPSSDRDDVYLALREMGVSAHIIEANAAFDYGAAVCLQLARGVYTTPLPVSVGVLEGGVASPFKFAAQTSSLAAALRSSGAGVVTPGGRVATLALMDDFGLFPSDGNQLRGMLDTLFAWLWRHRHRVQTSKLVFASLAEGGAPLDDFDYVWLPSPGDEPDAARRAAAVQHTSVTFTSTRAVYLGYELGGGRRGHVRRQIGMVHDAVRRMEQTAHARRYLTVERAAWLWTIYSRHIAEKWACVWPRVDDSDERALERAQRRAVVALLAPAAAPGAKVSSAAARAVLSLWPLKDRRWLDRLRYFYSLRGAMARPWRRAVLDGFFAFAQELSPEARSFARDAPTGEIIRAVRRLEDAKAEANAAGDASSSESEADASSDDDDPAGHRAQARLRTRKAKRIISGRVARERDADLREQASGRLLVALRPSRRWLEGARRTLKADAAGVSFLALLAGAFWPCSEVRARGGGPRRCACGYDTGNLTLHFCLGDNGDGVVCRAAGPARAEFRSRVLEAFAIYGEDAHEAAPPTHAKLARWLGGGGLSGLDEDLAALLPRVFAATLGEWAARERPTTIDAMFPDATRGSSEDESDDEPA